MTTLEFAREIERANRRLVELRRASRERFTRWLAVLQDASHDGTVCAKPAVRGDGGARGGRQGDGGGL